jgi:hypothetical protein
MYNPKLKIHKYKYTRKYKPNSRHKHTRKKSNFRRKYSRKYRTYNYSKKGKKGKKGGDDNNDSSSTISTITTIDYNTQFKGTELLPDTEIIQYIINNYNNYIVQKNSMDKQNKIVLNLKDCFDFNNKLDTTNNKQFTFRGEVNGNTKQWELDKLISYIFYMTMSSTFKPTDSTITEDKSTYSNRIIKELKYQIGKDVRRDNRLINGKEYKAEYFLDETKTNYQITDMFYTILMDAYTTSNSKININTINLFGLLSCQNIFNLITDLIVIQVNSMIHPETSAVMNASKNVTIEITPTKELVRFSFQSLLIVSEDMMLDPEKTCGNIKFVLEIDLKNKTYKFAELFISYNVMTCEPEIPEEPKKDVKDGAKGPTMYVNNTVNMNTPCEEGNNMCDDDNYLKYNDNEDAKEEAILENAKQTSAKKSVTATMIGKLKNNKLYNKVFNNKDVDFTTEVLPAGISAVGVATGPFILGAIGGIKQKQKQKQKHKIKQ